MPAGSDRLPDEAIARLAEWIDAGAPYTRTLVATRSGARFLVVPPAGRRSNRRRLATIGLAAGRNRSLRACRARRPAGHKPQARGRPPHADSPAVVRSDWFAPHARRSGRVLRRQPGGRVRAAGRSAAGQPPVWRALGPSLARRGSLCRQRRLRERSRPAESVLLSRLRHRRAERRHAVRSLCRVATGRR